jgi:hypothetical protein
MVVAVRKGNDISCSYALPPVLDSGRHQPPSYAIGPRLGVIIPS